MSTIKQHIVSIVGIVLLVSIPLMPTLIHGMYSFDMDSVEVVDMGSVAEEEDEKFRSITDLVSEEVPSRPPSPIGYPPSALQSPHIETHSPPPDMGRPISS